MARSKVDKLHVIATRAKEGGTFKKGTIEEAYPKASLLKRRIRQYFESCDMDKKHYSVPGLGLFLGLRTRVLLNYAPDDEEYQEHKLAIDYALQRIEAYAAERLYENKGSTKGTEFLLQNTLGYANKSDVNSKQELEVSEKQRIKQLPDEEVKKRLIRLVPRITQFVDDKASNG